MDPVLEKSHLDASFEKAHHTRGKPCLADSAVGKLFRGRQGARWAGPGASSLIQNDHVCIGFSAWFSPAWQELKNRANQGDFASSESFKSACESVLYPDIMNLNES